MLGGLKHKKGRISNDVGWRKPQEGEDFQAIFPEVETAKCIEGRPKLEHAAGRRRTSADSAARSHGRQDKP
jgi:hypothetical protein